MTKSRLHDDAMVQLLREDPEFAQHYLHQAFADIDDEGGQQAFLAALRHVVEARGGMSLVAERAGVSRETLYRTLSPKGNPTLKTLRRVVSATGFPFSHLATAP
ncbi:addiction module antidote protein [Yersinia enterocolitica]|jgi:probable addiction module antidote protein|uniref:Transcriptional regulator n=2 Tax=Enterobacterales TaxID=91347 RepID=A0A208ZZ17_YERIN|nr:MULTISPECIES: addiction module antidote protein [Enterobacterales]EBU9557444.1 putative addiction module antidote protein [Salmonella enterica subsp. enterica serovar Goldcoast]EIQ9988931.1 putative addiction module antidote protein [Escherichia coli]MCW1437049.1 putative addiction module antidote protein [Citrobacter freundii]CNI77922.1 putative DNA-binding prophage protein [Yersinia frederiksenii]EBY1295641.1 putative addiction module antidote protein [Salmonella enterica subsp. enterica 